MKLRNMQERHWLLIMVTVIIRDNGEPNVIKLTYENLWRELKSIPDAELRVQTSWLDGLQEVKTKFVCFVEADCLVSSGYFDSLAGYIKKNPQMGKLAILSSSTAVDNWAVRFYGYRLGNNYSDGVIPTKDKKNTKAPFYTIPIAYIPGAFLRLNLLRQIIDEVKPVNTEDLVYMSNQLSLGAWRKNWMVYIAPSSTYVTTDKSVNDIGRFDPKPGDLVQKFAKELI